MDIKKIDLNGKSEFEINIIQFHDPTKWDKVFGYRPEHLPVLLIKREEK